ncbi:MAG TPA: DUF1592 domain-containing protein [Polyangiaceae bacterium]|nr:DUF1592 domain-containing protein [Polyangiaceae bacterium]
MAKLGRARVPGNKLYSSLLMLGVLGAAACAAQIGDPVGSSGGGAGGGAGANGAAPGSTAGGSGSGAGSGSGSVAGSSSGSATGTAPVASPLSVSPADIRLGDADPTTASCATSGEELVPFRVLTRLNRAEYDNTVRDLLGDTTHLALTTLPTDYGDGAFDNNAEALTIDPTLAQTYQQVAETLAESAMAANSPGRPLILVCTTTDNACVTQIATSFAARAWRRPATTTEVTNLVALYTATRTAGFSFDQGIQILVEGALMSPNFLFRPEIDPTINSPSQHPVSSYELATRLSYFLWSTMPDAALETAAAGGQLATRAGIVQQVTRMWADPKASAMVTRFPGMWLDTLNVTIAKTPDSTIFPQFNATLQAAMQGETAAFMSSFMTGDVSFFDFIDAKYTYVNQTLATFYGIPGQFGTQMTRVDLTGNTERGGLLTQASFLTVAAAPERTSPVMRGQWVLSRILATPAPPPPQGIVIPPISAATPADGMTFRQKMEEHAKNPVCAACHNLMDPIGFGLENYDAIGEWRTTDNNLPVDASGTLQPSGQMFTGAIALESILKTDTRVPSAVVQYLLSYALGRSVNSASDQWGADQCAVGALAKAFQTTDNSRMAAFVSRVAGIDAMRVRRAAP